MLNHNSRFYLLLFFLALVIFIIAKIPALYLPYFWDELGVYSRSSMYLAEHGLSLLPADLPPELSRGHPLLFPFIYGLAYKLFGLNVVVGHSVSLIVSILLVCSVYYIISKEKNRLAGLLAAVLLMVQPVFFAQSVMVLPEIMLALLCLWAVYTCYKKQWLLFAVFAAAAIMIKESAIILPAFAIVYAIVLKLRGDDTVSLKYAALIVSPWFLFGMFLLVQKVQNGWYFFPLHIESVSLTRQYILQQNSLVFNFLFGQGRCLYLVILALATIVLLLRNKLRLYGSFVLATLLFGAAFYAFCIVNFYMDRYTLPLLPMLCSLVVLALYEVWKQPLFVSAVVMLLSAEALNNIHPDKFAYDSDMAYTQISDVEQQAVNYINTNVQSGGSIGAAFPFIYALNLEHTGFEYVPKHTIILGTDKGTDYVITEAQGNQTVDTARYKQAVEFEKGYAWLKLWNRKE